MARTIGRREHQFVMHLAYIKPASFWSAPAWPLWAWGLAIFCALLLLALLVAGIVAALQSDSD